MALRSALRRLGLRADAATLAAYRRINHELWGLYAKGRMAGPAVARERFRRLLSERGAEARLAKALDEGYLADLSRRGEALPGARRALARLRRRFALAVVTNGYDRVQHSRLRAGRLLRHFDAIVTSEGCGYTKPHRGIVDAALASLGVTPAEALLVGDDLSTDRGAARSAGVPFVWLDRGVVPARAGLPRRRVGSLSELAEQLGC
ncbi:MAG: HAD-IA family hydrolase [Vicinamibacteria bacterium]